MARHRARRDHDDRRGAPAGAALPARDRGSADVRPVRRRGGTDRRLGRPPRAQVNPELLRVARDDWARGRIEGPPPGAGRQATATRDRAAPAARGPRRRAEVVERLDRAGLLPAIVFIFSRVGCDAAVQQCLNANLRLTTPEERDEIVAFVEERCSNIPDEDLRGARLPRVPRRPHPRHRRPPRRDAADVQGVRRGAVRARAVSASCSRRRRSRSASTCRRARWSSRSCRSGTARPMPTSRRGSTPSSPAAPGAAGSTSRATAWCSGSRASTPRPSPVWRPRVPIRSSRASARRTTWRSTWCTSSGANAPASCSSRRSPSSRPTRPSSGCARQLRKSEDALDGYAEAAACDRGDFMEYAALRHQLSDTEKNLAKSRRFDHRQEVIDSLESLRPGDVIEVPSGRFAGMAVVIDPGLSSTSRGPTVRVRGPTC